MPKAIGHIEVCFVAQQIVRMILNRQATVVQIHPDKIEASIEGKWRALTELDWGCCKLLIKYFELEVGLTRRTLCSMSIGIIRRGPSIPRPLLVMREVDQSRDSICVGLADDGFVQALSEAQSQNPSDN